MRGDDASLVGQATHELLAELAAGTDPSMVVEEHGGPVADELDVGMVVDALTTPPFLTDRRIVVVRDAGRLSAADASRLAACLDDPLPGVTLVLVAGGGTVPAALVKAIGRGGVVDTAVGTGRARTQWLTERLHEGPVKLDARAGARLGEHLGGDVSRLRGMLEALASAYGEGASIDVERLEPFLGEAGTVAPWDLTDAIDAGETDVAMAALHRLFGAGGYHSLQVLAVLHRHYQAMLRLDGSGCVEPRRGRRASRDAQRVPGPQGARAGTASGPGPASRRAVTLLADADLDVRGRSALPEETVLEVLVGRLSRLGAGRDGPARRGGSRGRAASRRTP